MTILSSTEELLTQLEKSLLQPHTRKSDVVSQLLFDDFVEFSSSGRRLTKPDVIQALQTESPVQIETSELLVRFLAPDIALLTYIAFRFGCPSSSSLRSSLWKQLDGCWQLVFHQGTPTEQQP